ncbi:MAG TPA: TonB family protein [Terriglobales bacterium]|nr:TonB family protein [Terriglobales bacterium]
MSITGITPVASPSPPQEGGRRSPLRRHTPAPPDYTPELLLQLQDDLARSRMREALWLSVILHLMVVMALLFAPRLLPTRSAIVLVTPRELINNQELTYLDLPKDQQTPPPTPPKTDIISDKNRIATSHTPRLNREELKRILDSARPGAPGAGVSAPPSQPAPQVAQGGGQQAQPQQQTSQQQQGRGPTPPPTSQTAQLETPPGAASPGGGAFRSGGLSPGSLIDQAARAAAANRGAGGVGGDFGVGSPTQGQVLGNMEVLSDTMGVDFGPYLSRVLHDVRQNWYLLIPEVARAPMMKKGKVSIEFAITKNGQVAGMRLIAPSGDASLDRAAWGGITGSNPFQPLPTEFRGDYLALRFHFFYNPDRNDLR